jgi:hypothetical protein
MMNGLIASILLTLMLELEEYTRKHWRQQRQKPIVSILSRTLGNNGDEDA